MKQIILAQTNKILWVFQAILVAIFIYALMGCAGFTGSTTIRGQGYSATVSTDGKSVATDTTFDVEEILRRR